MAGTEVCTHRGLRKGMVETQSSFSRKSGERRFTASDWLLKENI